MTCGRIVCPIASAVWRWPPCWSPFLRYVGGPDPPHGPTISSTSPKPGRVIAHAVAATAAPPRGNKVVSGGGGGGGGARLVRPPPPPVAVPPGPPGWQPAASAPLRMRLTPDKGQDASPLHRSHSCCCCTHCSWLRLTPACRRCCDAG